HKEFPVLGPIVVTFDGAVGLMAHTAIGYDTFGLRQWKKTGDPLMAADGFYIEDKPAGSTTDPAEIEATGKISIGAGVDVIIAGASISGDLLGDLQLNLEDPNNDGKVR